MYLKENTSYMGIFRSLHNARISIYPSVGMRRKGYSVWGRGQKKSVFYPTIWVAGDQWTIFRLTTSGICRGGNRNCVGVNTIKSDYFCQDESQTMVSGRLFLKNLHQRSTFMFFCNKNMIYDIRLSRLSTSTPRNKNLSDGCNRNYP